MIPLITCIIIAAITWYYTYDYMKGKIELLTKERDRFEVMYTTKSVQPIIVGDILDEENLKHDFEMELSTDVAEILWSIRLTPYDWSVKSDDMVSDKWRVRFWTGPMRLYQIIHIESGHAVTYDDINNLGQQALVAMFHKLKEFQRDVLECNDVFDKTIKLPVPQLVGTLTK